MRLRLSGRAGRFGARLIEDRSVTQRHRRRHQRHREGQEDAHLPTQCPGCRRAQSAPTEPIRSPCHPAIQCTPAARAATASVIHQAKQRRRDDEIVQPRFEIADGAGKADTCRGCIGIDVVHDDVLHGPDRRRDGVSTLATTCVTRPSGSERDCGKETRGKKARMEGDHGIRPHRSPGRRQRDQRDHGGNTLPPLLAAAALSTNSNSVACVSGF